MTMLFTDDRLVTARRLLAALRTVPALAARYPAELSTLDDLMSLPTLDKNDFNVALDHLEPRSEHGSTWIFSSGGSTGAPKLGYAPTGLYMARVHQQWAPLGPGDLFVNAWASGKLWGSHYLFNALADLCGCRIVPLGAIDEPEFDPWLAFFAARSVTSVGGTPSTLRLLFAHARAAGVTLPNLRSVLWLGEAWDPQLDADIPAVAPNAGRWGLYGSTETWVVGTNTPACAADTFHPLPTQLVHVDAEELVDITSVDPSVLNPVLRYRTGDAGQLVSCACGNPEPALRLLGRRDGVVKFRGTLVHVDDLVRDVAAMPGVRRAQLVITEHPDRASGLEVLVTGSPPDLAELRGGILAWSLDLNNLFAHDPEAFTVRVVDSLVRNVRTGKTPNLVIRHG
jgi:phenylacetate-coenzyme A ligase PaaK-like adenylate-forming protein